MLYKEYLPHPELQQWVECYWKFVAPPNSDTPVAPFEHVYPPEGACSLLFVKVPAIHYQGIFFAGPSTKVHEVTVFPNSITVGIRLKPGYSRCLNSIDPGTIINSSVAVSEPTQWQTDFLDCLTVDFDNPRILDDLLLQNCLPTTVRPDPRIIKAVDLIIETAGDISITDLCDQCFLGDRQLQRLFLKQTGIGIKQFCQIRRLRQAVVDLYVQRRPWAQMVVERGFTDQAHFYKSFRNVAAYKLDRFLNHIDLIDHQLL
nr:AraC family transcriptional regulator [uncultured Mucilaginibacter sp.]